MAASSNIRAFPTLSWRVIMWGGAVLVLLAPLVASLFTPQVAWTGRDFLVFGIMLLAACGVYELAARVSGRMAYRAAIGVAVAVGTALLLVWINLAVGIIGNEDNPANLIFGGVLAVAMVGALLARLRPPGMARAMIATAIAQALAGLVAMVAGWGYILILTGIFVALWLTSARLFGKAAAADRARSPA